MELKALGGVMDPETILRETNSVLGPGQKEKRTVSLDLDRNSLPSMRGHFSLPALCTNMYKNLRGILASAFPISASLIGSTSIGTIKETS
jgi:hypothetical protein